MIVFIPPGDGSDPTRAPAFYNDTYEYLKGLGVAAVTGEIFKGPRL